MGEIRHINPEILDQLMRSRLHPGGRADRRRRGEISSLNINADTVAGKIAEALKAEKLMLLTDVDGVRSADGKFVRSLTAAEAEKLIEAA